MSKSKLTIIIVIAVIVVVSVVLGFTFAPCRVWYKDRGKTIPWVSGDRVTGNITLYAG